MHKSAVGVDKSIAIMAIIPMLGRKLLHLSDLGAMEFLSSPATHQQKTRS